jgi:hypothetical protein
LASAIAANFARPWYSLDQNFLPFGVEFRRQQTDARDVTAGTSERSNNSFRHHVLGHADQRYGTSDALKRLQRTRRTSDDRVWRGFHQGRR